MLRALGPVLLRKGDPGPFERLASAVTRPRHEIKYDGFRILEWRDANGVRLYTRMGIDFAHRFPRIVEAVSKLPVRSCFIDGEAIVTDERGLAVFDLIRHKRHGEPRC